MGQLLTFYRYVICLAVIPASYAGHKAMADSLQVSPSSRLEVFQN
jgi:hypothetical protein